jgi:beta-lactamase class A
MQDHKKMRKIFYPVMLLLFGVTHIANAQTDLLQQRIEQYTAGKKATIGVSVLGIEDHYSMSVKGDYHFPMQSVFKFHIAIAVLSEVDKGKLRLEQPVEIKKDELLPNTWSPIRQKYPEGATLSLQEILQYTVSESDNIGCDILLRLMGGPGVVNDYFVKNGLKDISIQANEDEMHKAWDVQYRNWTTPVSATNLLKVFYGEKLLSQQSMDLLWRMMVESPTGKQRIKGQLPEGTVVAHKTGTSDTNKQGITAAVNDIGIVTLPNGKHFAISVFVSNSAENMEGNEKIISDIGKYVWDYYMGK